jgi:hypothetical protein
MMIWFVRDQFPPAIIRHEVWLCVRFTLSYRRIMPQPLYNIKMTAVAMFCPVVFPDATVDRLF